MIFPYSYSDLQQRLMIPLPRLVGRDASSDVVTEREVGQDGQQGSGNVRKESFEQQVGHESPEHD